MDIRGPERPSNAPCCLDLLRRHLRLFLGLRIGLDSRSHPRIAGCRGDDLFMAVGSDSGSILIYRVFGVHPELLIYIAALVGIIAIAMIWWRHAGNNKL
jgi:hypothetical protein